MLETIKTIILFIILMTVLISVHELGHLIAAKIFNVYCGEYSIGMGPKIYSHQFKETNFSIRALPIGGFVSMAGDEENGLETKTDTTNVPFERTLNGVAKWKKIIIMYAGIFMNFVLAILIYSGILLYNGSYAKDTKPIISSVVENYPAYNAGLQEGDIITHIEFDNGASMSPKTYSELSIFALSYYEDGPWHLKVLRDGETLDYDIDPILEDNRYVIGITFSNTYVNYVDINIFNCLIYGFEYALMIVRITVNSLITLLKGVKLDSLSGPIGIYTTVKTANDYGLLYYLQLIAMISINVAAFNTLPLPVLDGGRAFLLLIEIIIGRPISKKTEEIIMQISVALILMLFVYVSFNDIGRLIGG